MRTLDSLTHNNVSSTDNYLNSFELKTNVYYSNKGSLDMYVGHRPTIRMLLLKLKIPPEK
jgi:hypothetical protein